jgi:hypothetical protein
MKTAMQTTQSVTELIGSGKRLILAADEKVLQGLPQGDWIAGTIPYFMSEQGGKFDQDHVYVTELPPYVESVDIKLYSDDTIHQVYEDAPDHGFSVIIIPATCSTHIKFALSAPNFSGFAIRPLIGWISGVFLDDLGTKTPKIYDGQSAKAFENGAVVMHVRLPSTKMVDIEIVNMFEQGDGQTIVFPKDGFSATTVEIDGKNQNFAEFLNENQIDTKLPLVADMAGAMINTSFQTIDAEKKEVHFYAPVFTGVEYKIAKPVLNYEQTFLHKIPEGVGDNLFFSCNCILNYLYAELEGKKTDVFTGPVTFGEIAYQLLNQTLAYITIEEA